MPWRRRSWVAGVSLTWAGFFATSLGGVAVHPAHGVDLRQQLGRQRGSPRVEVLVELRPGGDADDRARDAPARVAEGERHAGRREAVRARQLVVAPGGGQRLGPAPALLLHRLEDRQAAGRRAGGIDAAGVVLAG